MSLLAISGSAWGAIAALAAPTLAFVTWLLARNHVENNEDSDAMARAITAVTDANSSLTATALTIIAPLQARIDALETSNADLVALAAQRGGDYDRLVQQMHDMQRQMRVVVDYVHTLRAQIVKLGAEPTPFPEELEGFTFD